MLKASTRRRDEVLSPIHWPPEPPPQIDGIKARELDLSGYVRWIGFREQISAGMKTGEKHAE